MLNQSITQNENDLIPVTRLTALWALSESMLGGLLHAAHIPLRGMIISSAAVIIICLIAYFSVKRGEILKATLIVLSIKAAISPHTPIAAYLAVFLQGLLGEIFFYKKRFFALSAILFGLVVGVLTGSQRIITYTLIFGTNFWEAINQFIKYVINEFFLYSEEIISFDFSLILIITYILIHVMFGIAAALLAFKLPQKLNSEQVKDLILSEKELLFTQISNDNKKNNRKPWWKKPSFYIIIISAVTLLIISYTNPSAINLSQKSILLMIIRAILIIPIWFYFLSPILLTAINKLLLKRKNTYADQVNSVLNHFPVYNKIAAAIWRLSRQQKGFRRLSFFITGFIINVLTLKISDY